MTGFHDVIADTDLPEDGKAVVQVNGWNILLCRAGGVVHAINDRCSHAASPLSGGRVRRGSIMCPLHGARFELATGRCLGGDYRPLRMFAVRVEGGRIAVEVPAEAPGMADLAVRAL